MEAFFSPEIFISLLTLTALEIVLGIDNVIFIAILAGRLPREQQDKARRYGLTGALFTRLGLLSVISFIVSLDKPFMQFLGKDLSWKSIILIMGGIFLLFKATKEIHHKIEKEDESSSAPSLKKVSFWGVIGQVAILDLVFSIDSVITAVGLTPYVSIMVIANVIALAVMLVASKSISNFVESHPSLKVLALSFLLMIGLVLITEGFGIHVPKGYIYFAMGFSVFVELINIKINSRK